MFQPTKHRRAFEARVHIGETRDKRGLERNQFYLQQVDTPPIFFATLATEKLNGQDGY